MKHGRARWPWAIVAVLIAASGLCGSAGADVSPSVIARVDRPTSVAASGDRVVFSRYVGRGRYRLVSVEGGKTSVLPVKSRRAAFDVDLGTDARGRVVAAYSRCVKEPAGTVNRYLPAYVLASGCKLYIFDFTSQKERRLQSVSRGDTSDYLPSVSGGRVAFARIFERRRGLGGVLPYLYSARLDGTRLRRFAAGPRGEYSSIGGDFLRFTDANGPGPIRRFASSSREAHLPTAGGMRRRSKACPPTALPDARAAG